MSLTRKMLKGMSLTDEQIDTIIEAHTEAVDGLKAERDRYKAEADKNAGAEEKVAGYAELEKANKALQKQYDELKAEYDDYKSDQTAKAEKSAKETAYKAMLKEAGIPEKRIPSIMRVTSMADIKLDKDGKLKDYDKLVDGVKDEWSDFIATEVVKGAETTQPPTKGGGKMTKDDILKIEDTSERQQAIADNHELFGF